MSKTFRVAIGLLILLVVLVAAYIMFGKRDLYVENMEEWLALSPVRLLDSAGPYETYPGQIELGTDGKGCWICIASMSPTSSGDPNAERDLLIYRSDDNGETWSSEALLHPDFEVDDRSDQRPNLATDRMGKWVVVWSAVGTGEEEGTGYIGAGMAFVSRSEDDGETWSSPQRLNTAYDEVGTDSERLLDVVVDDHGNWVCATSVEDFDRDAYGRQVYRNVQIKSFRSTNAGESWSEAQVVREPPKELQASFYNLALTTTRSGQAILSFDEGTPNEEEQRFDYRVFVYTSPDGGLDWGEPEITEAGALPLLLLAPGSRNSLVGIWERSRAGVQGDRILDGLTSARSSDSGRTWSPAVDVAGPPHENEVNTLPSFATDGRGGLLVAWQAFGRSGRDSDIYGSVSLDDGRRWSTASVLNPGAESDKEWEYEFAPTVATDGRGRWIVVWQSGGTSGYRLYYLVCDALS
jgi:hypothetical protein